jgi:arsenate reductase
MKLSLRNKSETRTKTKQVVLFVCVENAGRSQMAEGFFRKYAPSGYEPLSAGTRHKTEINPIAVESMREIGIDISKQKPKELTGEMLKTATRIINMGCMDKNFCPTMFFPKVVDWGIEDPKGKPIEKVRAIRNEIEARVKEIATQLGKETET